MLDETPTQVKSDAPVQTETAPAPNSEADLQVNNTTPEAAQGEGAPELNATETVEEKLYAGKYKSAEDLEKAYLSAQSEASKMAGEKAELSRILSDAFAEAPVSQPQAQSQDDYGFQDESAQPVNREIEGLKRDQAVTSFIFSHPDADGAAIMEVLSKDPNVAHISTYQAKLNYAHAVSQNSTKSKTIEAARKQAQVDTQVKVAEKQAAQVESATKQAPTTKQEPLTREQIRAASHDDKLFAELMKKHKPGIGRMLR